MPRVDFVRPIQAVVPGVQGRILSVLAETSAELNLRTVARLAGVSLAQASRVMPGLVDLGIVRRREVPPSALFQFVHENVASRAISALADARRTVFDELGRQASAIVPAPVSVVIFGSFARGEAGTESDLDVVVVRPHRVSEDDGQWRASVAAWSEAAGRLTGNRIEVLEVGAAEAGRALSSPKAVWSAVVSEGVVVFGLDLSDLKRRRIA